MNMEGRANLAALDASWISSIKHKLQVQSHCVCHGQPPAIYRVPQSIRHIDVDAYDPMVLSIGPYHRATTPNLEAMEKHKWRYLHDLLCLNPEVRLEMYLMEMKSVEDIARRFYSETVELCSDDFVEMMLLDGCFIVQFLIKLRDSSLDFIFLSKDVEEPLFNTMWILPPIAHDILLLENQLPFFIPQRLFELSVVSGKGNNSGHSLMELGCYFLNCLVPLNSKITTMPASSVHHLLHLFHTHLLPSPQYINFNTSTYSHQHSSDHLQNLYLLPVLPSRVRQKSPIRPDTSERKAKSIPSASELHDAGVKFKKVVKASSFMEIEFDKGIMKIPQLYIYPNANSFFRNLIAFEQCYPNMKTHFTAYVKFMEKFINTPKDVMLLKQQGILQHGLCTDEELALLFNQLGKGINFYYSKSYLSTVYRDVKSFYESDWHKWRASLMREYFGNPWALLSLLGAVVLLLLTIAQTFIAILSHLANTSQA